MTSSPIEGNFYFLGPTNAMFWDPNSLSTPVAGKAGGGVTVTVDVGLLSIVLWHAHAFGVHAPELVLGVGVALVGERAEEAERGGVIAALVSGYRILEWPGPRHPHGGRHDEKHNHNTTGYSGEHVPIVLRVLLMTPSAYLIPKAGLAHSFPMMRCGFDDREVVLAGPRGRSSRPRGPSCPSMPVSARLLTAQRLLEWISGAETLAGSTLMRCAQSVMRNLVAGLFLALATHPAASESIPLQQMGGVYMVAVRINDAVTIPYVRCVVHRPLPIDDPIQRCPDISQASALLDWKPRTEFRVGLQRTIAYFEALLVEDRELPTTRS